jgi:SAM-dependent methyltransferase
MNSGDFSVSDDIMLSFQDHFSSVSADYAVFRPSYPDTLFAWLASVAPACSCAWDSATGSGQAASGLVFLFDRVIATDASAAQIRAAARHPRIDYRVALAESSGLDDHSVDLVTVAQALHWFDMEKFFTESRRVLVEKGVLAAWSYGVPVVEGGGVDELVRNFYRDIVGPFWPPQRAIVDSGYREIVLPFEPVRVPEFNMSVSWNLYVLLAACRIYQQGRITIIAA